MIQRKKSIVLFIAAALCGLSSMAGEPGVTFLFTNGKKASFAFTEKPKMKFVTEGIALSTCDDATYSYAFSDVQRYYFEEQIETGLRDANSTSLSTPVFSYTNGTMSASGLTAAETVTVLSVDGRLIAKTKSDNAGQASISLNAVTNGTYIVSISNGVSFKLIKK